MSITQRNLSGYDLPVIKWERVRHTLASDHTQAPGIGGPDRHTSWLTTTNPDGTSHVSPLGTVQLDGVLYFNSGPATRKSRNVAANPQCVLSIATIRFDLVVEGRAVRVTDGSELETVVEAFSSTGLARTGRRRCADRRIQRAVGGSTTVVALQDRTGNRVRVRHRRDWRCHQVRDGAKR